MNSTRSPSERNMWLGRRWWPRYGRSAGHSVSGNLRLTTGLRTSVLQAPGWMLGLMQTTLFFVLHCPLPKSFCGWQLSAAFVSLHVIAFWKIHWRLERGAAQRAPLCGRSMGRPRTTCLSVFWPWGMQSQDSSLALGAKGRGDKSFRICRPLERVETQF